MSTYSGESEDQWSASSPQDSVSIAASSSSSPPQRVPENSCLLTELLHSVGINGSESYDDDTPYLKIMEQPQSYYKFRYKSEMENSHGCIYGKSFEMDKTLPKSYPEVELFNYDGEAKIKCRLVQMNNDYEHPHTLYVNEDEDISVTVPVRDNYRVRFQGMCIIHKARDDVTEWLYRGHDTEDLSLQKRTELQNKCKKLGKLIDLNCVRLKFSAHHLDSDEEICNPVFSLPIKNSKSPATNVLKICRLSQTHTRACGGDDVIMLVEKVVKKNIKIRFFEKPAGGSEMPIWSQEANFMESDVHHQYAIVFRTPAYKDQNISSRVKVYVELFRPTDGQTSEPKEFFYTPGPIFHRTKKRKIDCDDSNSVPVQNYSANIANPKLPSPAAAAPLAAPPAPEDQSPDADFFELLHNIDLYEYFDLPQDLVSEINSEVNNMELQVFEADSGRGQGSRKDIVVHDTAKIKGTVYSSDDQVVIEKMVKQLQSMIKMIRIMDVTKRDTLTKTLEALFEVRLSNGDTFLHLILGSKQPLLHYVINLVHESNMTHLLNLRNASMQTILHLAVVHDLPDLVETLLSKGCDPMLEDAEGNNVVHYAVMHPVCLDPILRTVKKLNLPHDLNASNNEEQTALHYAVIYASETSVRQLLENGASYLARDCSGRTALHLAAYDDCLPALAALLDHVLPKDVDAVDGRGFTALQILCDHAVKKDSLTMIKMLLDKNADPMLKREGYDTTAWRLARDKPAVRVLMRKYLADDPESSNDEESEDEFESADEGDMADQEDFLLDLMNPMNKLSIGEPAKHLQG